MLSELYDSENLQAPGRWIPCPPVTDHAAWDALPSKERIVETGFCLSRKSAAVRIPPLPLSLWTEFLRTGNRSHYEKNYFARRRSLCSLVMAECLEHKGRLMPAITDSIWAILEESAWQLPAHNSYLRDTPQLPLPDPAHPVIDLFAAETGALLSMVYYLLKPQLEKYAPSITRRMKSELDRRIVRPYLHTHFWWMGNGDEPMCNWTPWCTQNILITVSILHPADRKMLRTVIHKAAYSLDCFLKDYGTDGCCSEGAQYYRHAALTFFNALEILCSLAPGVFDRVWSEEKIRNIAEYIAHMHVSGPWYLNFSDCSPMAGLRGAREYLFGKKISSSLLTSFAAEDFCKDPDPFRFAAPDDSEGINLFYLVQTAFTEAEIRAFHDVPQIAVTESAVSDSAFCNSRFYEKNGLLTCRCGAFTAGIKAGNNADSHNHNDTGSITLYKNGLPLLIDIGVESYTRKTFSPQRYEIWTMQSSWHNLPEFDPEGAAFMQLPGAEYRARDVSLCEGACGLSMDLAAAYSAHGEIPELGSYLRSARFLPDHTFRITDETDYPGLIALTLMSVEKPSVHADRILWGNLASCRLTGAEKISICPVPVSDPRLRTAWPELIYRTRIYYHHRLQMQLS